MAPDTSPVEPPETVTVKTAAQMLGGLSNKTVYALCKRGELACGQMTDGGLILIERQSVLDYARRITSQGLVAQDSA